MLKYNIKDIRDDGVALSRDLDTEYVTRLLGQAGVEHVASGPAGMSLDLTISRAEETIFVRGSINGSFTVTCGRCLEPAVVTIEESQLHLTFFPPGTAEEEEDEELALQDLDTCTHDGKKIDLEPLIQEQLVLAIPIMPLCKGDCEGICTRCGVNLNTSSCDCEQVAPVANSWTDALGKLKKNLAES
jgi:DUF177 domain-containing protein